MEFIPMDEKKIYFIKKPKQKNAFVYQLSLYFSQLSQIQAMNFAPLTHHMDFHTTQSVTDHSRTTFPIIHCTNTAVCTDHAHTCKQSPNHHHPITHTHTLHKPWTFSHSLPSIVSLATYKAFPWFLSLFPVFPSILGLISCVLILPVPLDYSLCLAHWIKFADRRPTLALGLFSASSLIYLFATVWPCLYRLCSGIKACRWIRMSHVSSAL